MSDDGADGDPKGAPDAAPDAAGDPAPRSRWMRLAILGGIGAIAIVSVILVTHRPPPPIDDDLAPNPDAGPLVSAPKRPALPDPARGNRLTGFVVDGTNAPVVGAEVTAELERGAPDRAPVAAPGSPVIPPLPEILAGPGSGAGSAAPAVIVAPVTGSDGRFVLDTQLAGRYRLRVTGPGLLPAEVRYVPVPSDEARIVVARRVSIEGTVVDGKSPAGNVTVGLRGEAIGGGIEIKSDPKGGFAFKDLPEGRYQLYAWHDTLAARAVRITRLGAGPFPPVELSLEAAAIVVGRVVDREDAVGLSAAIELRPSGDDQAPRYVRSATDGTFKIEGVPNGKWIADAYAPGYASPGGVELDAGHGIPELALSRGAVIEGKVADRDGKPIANAAVRALGGTGAATPGTPMPEVSAAVEQDKLRRFSGRISAPVQTTTVGSAADPQLLPRGELGVMVGPIPPIPPPGAQVARPASIDFTKSVAGGPPSPLAELAADPPPLAVDPARAPIWITGADGAYRITGVPKGKHVVLALAPAFAEGRSKQVAVEPPQVIAGIDIVLGPGTFVSGRVTDQHGIKVVGAQIHAQPAASEGNIGAPLDAFTDEDGGYKIGPLTGAVELVASAFGHADTKRTVDIPLATGKPDDRVENFVLTVADAVLSGTLDDTSGAPVPTANVEVVAGAGAGRHAIVAADGTFSIDMLPVGPLRVRVSHPDYPPVELDATASSGDRQKVRLRIPLGGAVAGVLLDGTSGAPVPAVTVNGYGPGGATADATSDTAGLWKLGPLRPGKWKLTIEQPGYLAAQRELDVPAARAPGATSVHDVRFDLSRGALVGGTVRDARGRRVPGAQVTVQAATGDGPTATGTTDSQGEFRIRDAPTGELAITVSSPAGAGQAKATIRPGDEVLGLSIELR